MKAKFTIIAGALAILACAAAVVGAWIWAGANVAAYLTGARDASKPLAVDFIDNDDPGVKLRKRKASGNE
jgi:hypothetical protein